MCLVNGLIIVSVFHDFEVLTGGNRMNWQKAAVANMKGLLIINLKSPTSISVPNAKLNRQTMVKT